MVGIRAWFCAAIAQSGPSKNYAIYRSAKTAKELFELAANNPKLLIPILVNSTSEEELSIVSKIVSSETNNFDFVINCAGYLHKAKHGPEKFAAN